MELADLSEQEREACIGAWNWEEPPADVIGTDSVFALWCAAWLACSQWVKSRTVAEGERPA